MANIEIERLVGAAPRLLALFGHLEGLLDTTFAYAAELLGQIDDLVAVTRRQRHRHELRHKSSSLVRAGADPANDGGNALGGKRTAAPEQKHYWADGWHRKSNATYRSIGPGVIQGKPWDRADQGVRVTLAGTFAGATVTGVVVVV